MSTKSKTAKGSDRLPPHDVDMERGVCGCVLMSASECLDALRERGYTQEWCYDLRHQLFLDICLWLDDHGKPVELLTVFERLKETGMIDQFGGLSYLNEILSATVSAANLPYYLEVVRGKFLLRKIVQACTEATLRVFEHEGDADSLVSTVAADLLRLEELAGQQSNEMRVKQSILDEVIPDLESHYSRGRAQITGVTTGLEYLDKILGGMGAEQGNYYVVGARPNTGKTSLVTQIAMHAAQDYVWWKEKKDDAGNALFEEVDGKPGTRKPVMERQLGISVGISSLEMRRKALVKKMLFQRGQVDLQRWRTGYANEGDLVLLTQTADAIAKANRIVIDDTPRLRIGRLKAQWRRWYRQYGVRLFVLDYLQLMQGDTQRFRPDRVQELAEVSAELQALGKELNCPMIILAQMNRDYEKDPSRAPRLSDLKDCGAVEQDADVVMFLYEPRLSDTNKEFFEKAMAAKFGEKWKKWDGRPQRINALIAKNRLGPKGKAELLLLHSSTTFVDWNVWLKENKLKAAAMGESRYQGEDADSPDNDLPVDP